MPEVLDIITPEGDVKEQLESARNNFLTLTKQTLKAGTYILTSGTVKTSQAVSSASYVDLTQFQGAFVSSGGIVTIQAQIPYLLSNQYLYFNLYVDDQVVGWAIGGSSAVANITALVTATLSLNAGNHTWKIKCKLENGGSVNVGTKDEIYSAYSIVESIRG